MDTKHFSNVIKNNSPDNYFAWKYNVQDFNDGSTLIVNPGEEAIFVINGKIEASFTEGRYVLNTDNFPFVSSLINLFSGGVSSFPCFVIFIKK